MNNKRSYDFLKGVDPTPLNPYKVPPPKQEAPVIQEERKQKPKFDPKEKREPPKQYVNIHPQNG